MFKSFLLAIGITMLMGCLDAPGIQLDIQNLMEEQARSWNQKDLEGFMLPYWHSDSLRFMGKSGVTLGWQSTLDRYKKNYSPDAMGMLTFDNLHFDVLSSKATWVDGRWRLFRAADTLSGRFSLLWKKINGQWQIVADHSS